MTGTSRKNSEKQKGSLPSGGVSQGQIDAARRSPREIVERIYHEDIGFLPTNKVIKPVHIANGLARSITGRSYDTTALTQLLRRFVEDQRRNVLVETNTNETILTKYGEAFLAKSGTAVDPSALGELRSLAYGALAADGAVFGDPEKSSFSLSNERFVTRDPSDRRSGQFLARLVTEGRAGDAARELERALQTESDPWTVLAAPMLNFAQTREEKPTPAAAELRALGDALFKYDRSGEFKSATMANLRQAFDRLARHEALETSTLNSLRRLVLFGCFSLHVHLISRWSEIKPGRPRPPILLDLFDGARPALRDASRATVRAAGDAIEGMLMSRLTDILAVAVEGSRSVASFLAAIVDETARASVRDRFQLVLAGGEVTEIEALADAFLEQGLEDLKARPVEFLTELGRRAGYMTPWANQGKGGKLQKRYGMNAEFLEVLVASLVDPGDELEFGELLDRARDQFGIVVGRASDDQIIRRNNLNEVPFGTPVSVREEDLRDNVEAFRRAIEDIGYAKRYADGRTLITTSPEALASA